MKNYSNKTFEEIKHIDEVGVEFWYARELQSVLTYKEWRKFENVISKAKEACKNSDSNVLEHFVDVDKMVQIGSGAERKQNNDSNALEMVEKTLIQMRKGGIFDHIGYGFSRYSTDKYYLVSLFEKMLNDNSLLITAYAVAYHLTDNDIYLDTAEKIEEYILKEMTSEVGGFYSAQDADSEGVEGKYYTFSLKEIINILVEDKGMEFAKVYDITEKGNFEGLNIPNLLKSNDMKADFQDEIKKLYEYRKNRFKLHLDDKILLSWNSMMIVAMAMLYRVTKNDKYLKVAQKAQEFIEKNMSEGLRLYTSFRDGKCSKNSFLDDYAFYVASLKLKSEYKNLS